MDRTDSYRPDVRGLPMVHPPDPARLEAERAWLAEVSKRPWLGRQLAYLSRGGPGYLQSALTLGGGSASACILAGAAFGYQLLWVAPLGMILGGIVFAAIAHQTLSTGMRPFEAMRRHAGGFFAWGWAIGTVIASVVWHFAQYSLASAVLVDLAAVAGWEVPRWAMGLLVLAWAVPTALSFGSRSGFQRGFERLIRAMVWMIVALFAVVAIRVGFGDPAAIASGFVPRVPPDLDLPGGKVSAVAVVISGLATAIGVNMTFLYPYSLLARGWGREHRELARADLVMGMVVPFTIVTSLVVIVSAATLHEGFSGKSSSPIEAAGTRGSLLGPGAGRVAFDLGLLAMLLTTITLHMVCSGLACGEMFKLRVGSPGYRLATLLPAPGVLGSVYWTSLSIWVAVPTSIVAGFLLPLAYVGFIRLQASSEYLGSDRPRGVKGALWLAGMAIATLVVLVFLGWYLVEKGPAFLEMLRPSAETAA
ncbi:MAG: NRAMP family divalent metal transporter [Phycisphaerales bacterium]